MEVVLQTGMILVKPKSDWELDLAAIPRAIQASGFVPAGMRVQGLVKVEGSGAEKRLRFRSWGRSFPAEGVPAELVDGVLEVEVDYSGSEPVLHVPGDAKNATRTRS